MRWMKWSMMAAIGFGPAFVLADEPAKKTEDPVKFGIRVEVQTDDNKPKVFELGDGNSPEAREASKQALQLLKLFTNPKVGASITFDIKTEEPKAGGVLKPGQPLNVRQLPGGAPGQNPFILNGGPVTWHTAQVKHEKGTYLGITTDSPPPVLRKQLGLSKGMALVIDDVVPGSPAAKAGLQEFDVLQKLDDQLIVNQAQLTVLVRAHKAGDEVKITVIREAKPTVITAKLVEHDIEVAREGREEMITAQLRGMLNNLPMRQWEEHERREQHKPKEMKQLPPGASIPNPNPNSNPKPKKDKNADEK